MFFSMAIMTAKFVFNVQPNVDKINISGIDIAGSCLAIQID